MSDQLQGAMKTVAAIVASVETVGNLGRFLARGGSAVTSAFDAFRGAPGQPLVLNCESPWCQALWGFTIAVAVRSSLLRLP